MMAEKVVIHLGELQEKPTIQKQFCFNIVFISKDINVKQNLYFYEFVCFSAASLPEFLIRVGNNAIISTATSFGVTNREL